MQDAPGYTPLYRQVHDVLVRRVAQGDWKAGDALPSEQALAKELGVSQGTVRKVLDLLTADKLLERRQGKGTFVAETTQERALFRFFRIAHPGGRRTTPESGGERVKVRVSTAAEQQKLDLPRGAKVVEIERTRRIDGRPAIFETIVTPAVLFPQIEAHAPLPNTLYSLYQAVYGINITSIQEDLSADLANCADAEALGVAVGVPILRIDRIALSLEGGKVEWRRSRLASPNLVYAVSLA